MLPKSSKHYIGPTAETTGQPAQLVEDLISFYYAKVRKNLSDLTMHHIRVDNLGTFKVKKKELPKLVAKYTKHLSVLNPETFRGMAIKKDIEDRLKKVLAVQNILDEEAKRKQEIYQNRYGNTRSDLESQKRN